MTGRTRLTDAADPDLAGNAAQIAAWNDRAGDNWTALQERLDAMFAPLTAAALTAAAPKGGERVIDIGCGCGATLLELASRVGSEGRVLGVDVSEPMAGRARERIAAAGLGNAEVLVSDAASHAFPQAAADLLFSRFGVMFFADPAAAFANLRRAMRPGGRLLFVAWRALSDNAWFSVPLEAARPLLPPQPAPEPDAPGPFAFADEGRVRAILSQAGWRDIELRRRDVPIPVAGPGQIADATELATRLEAVARMLAEADADLRAPVRNAVAEALRAHDSPAGITLGGSVWLVSALA